MNNVGIFPPADPAPDGARPPRRRAGDRRILLIVSLLLCLGVLVAAAAVILTWPDEDATLVIDEPNAVLWGRTVNGPVEIAADDVTLRRMTIRTGADAAIRIRPGVAGAVIEDTEIYCVGRRTDGIVPGNYSAERVATHGCRWSFAQAPGAVATVVDCEQDGQRYSPDGPVVGGVDPDLPGSVPPTPATPSRGLSTVAAPTPITYWPGPNSTGVPEGTSLTRSGPLDLRRAGQVVTDLDIDGCVTVRAADVVIRRSRITCASPTFSVRTLGSAASVLLEDVEIDGRGRNSAAVCCGDYTLRRVDIHHVIDGPRLGSRSIIADSWIHDLVRVPSSHNDTLQTTGGSDVVVRHNRLDAYRPSTKDPFNACLMIGSIPGPAVRNLLFEDNYCNGGNYSVGVRADLVAANIVIRDNRFGRDYRYGVIARPDQRGLSWDRASNVWFDTGLPVVG